MTQALVGTPPSSCTSSTAATTVGIFGVHQVSSSLTVVCIDSFVVVVDNLDLVLSIDIQDQFVVEELFQREDVKPRHIDDLIDFLADYSCENKLAQTTYCKPVPLILANKASSRLRPET